MRVIGGVLIGALALFGLVVAAVLVDVATHHATEPR